MQAETDFQQQKLQGEKNPPKHIWTPQKLYKNITFSLLIPVPQTQMIIE